MMKRIITVAICFCALFASSISQSTSEFELEADITPQSQEFSSPEITWNLFKNALIDGDYELAHKCCCPGSNRFISKFEKLGTAKTKDIFQSMKRIEKIYQHDDKAKKVPIGYH